MDAGADGKKDKTDMNDKSDMYDESSMGSMTGAGIQDEGKEDGKGDKPHYMFLFGNDVALL